MIKQRSKSKNGLGNQGNQRNRGLKREKKKVGKRAKKKLESDNAVAHNLSPPPEFQFLPNSSANHHDT